LLSYGTTSVMRPLVWSLLGTFLAAAVGGISGGLVTAYLRTQPTPSLSLVSPTPSAPKNPLPEEQPRPPHPDQMPAVWPSDLAQQTALLQEQLAKLRDDLEGYINRRAAAEETASKAESSQSSAHRGILHGNVYASAKHPAQTAMAQHAIVHHLVVRAAASSPRHPTKVPNPRSARDYLILAREQLERGLVTAARYSLETAETHALNNNSAYRSDKDPTQSRLIRRIEAAREALNSNDLSLALDLTKRAIPGPPQPVAELPKPAPIRGRSSAAK
jgi:hypothetical protein